MLLLSVVIFVQWRRWPGVPRACFMGHKAESLNCQVGRDMTASTTEAIFNPLHSGIVRFMQGEVGFRQRGYRLQCGMSILVYPRAWYHSCEARQNQVVRGRRIHADTPPLPVRDEASQGSTASGRVAEREGIHADTLPQPVVKLHSFRQGGRARRDSCRHAATATP